MKRKILFVAVLTLLSSCDMNEKATPGFRLILRIAIPIAVFGVIALIRQNKEDKAIAGIKDEQEKKWTKEEVFEAIDRNEKNVLKNASADITGNREIVLEVIKKRGTELQFVSMGLKGDREIVLEAVKNNGWSLQYASEILKKDYDIVLEAVKNMGFALQFADKSLRKNKSIVLEALKTSRRAIEYADKSLLNDPEFIKMSKNI